jgi:hypothetical protein
VADEWILIERVASTGLTRTVVIEQFLARHPELASALSKIRVDLVQRGPTGASGQEHQFWIRRGSFGSYSSN